MGEVDITAALWRLDPRSDNPKIEIIARGIRNAFSERYDAVAPVGYPAVHHVTAPLRRWAAEHDDREHLHLWAGTGLRGARPGPLADLVEALLP
jgi:nitronate monooxygenase